MSTADRDPEKLWLETLCCTLHIYPRGWDNLQPSQSFKYRGISYFIQHALRTHGPNVHLIIASGGNAGLAAACASKALGLRCTVFLPEGVDPSTIDFMRKEGAEIVTEGSYYLQALRKAEEAVKLDLNACVRSIADQVQGVIVPAYDEPLLWEGHGSMIPEIARQLPRGTKPDAIFCSVGGGGLAGGVMQGCKSVGWDDVSFVALETTGSNCFHQSLALNPGPFLAVDNPPGGIRMEYNATHSVKIAHLSVLQSRASSLGASSPAAGVVKMALERRGGIKSVCVPDEMAMQAGLLFAEDHKMIVELACSATLTPAYKPALVDKLVPPSSSGEPRTLVFIVCGGFKISLEDMEEYGGIVEADAQIGEQWEVLCNGEQWGIDK